MPAGLIYVKFEENGSAKLHVNPQFEKMTGYSALELSTLDDLFPNLFGDREVSIREAYLADRAAGFPQLRHLICNRKDGEQLCVEFSASQVPGAEIWLLKDVTEDIKVQENCRALVELSSDGYLMFDENGIFDCNSGAVKCIGAKGKSDLMGRHPAEFSPEFQEDGKRSEDKANELMDLVKKQGIQR